jgi:hypothetical protein
MGVFCCPGFVGGGNDPMTSQSVEDEKLQFMLPPPLIRIA